MPELPDFTKPHVLRTDTEYDAAVAQIDALLDLDPPEGSEDDDLLQLLTVLVEASDREHYRVPERSSPQAVVDFMLEQNDLDRSAVAELMGGRSRVSEFFSGKRKLSRAQIEAPRDRLRVPANVAL